MPSRSRHITVAPRMLPECGRVDLQFDQVPHGVVAVAEQEARALDGAEQVADHREVAALDALEEQGRPAGRVHAPVDRRGFEVRVDLDPDTDELARPLQVGDTGSQAGVSHRCALAPRLRLQDLKSLWGFLVESNP